MEGSTVGLDPHAAGVADGSYPDPGDELTGSHGPVPAPATAPAPPTLGWGERIFMTVVLVAAIIGLAGWSGTADRTDYDSATQANVLAGPSFAAYLAEIGLDTNNPTITIGPQAVASSGDINGSGQAGILGGSGSVTGQNRPVVVRPVTIQIGTLTRTFAVDASTTLVVNSMATHPRIVLKPEIGLDSYLEGTPTMPRYDARKRGFRCGFDPRFWLSRGERSTCRPFGPQHERDFDPERLEALRQDPWAALDGRILRIEVAPSDLSAANN